MTLIEYPDLLQGSEEWLTARCGMVTASVVGNLVTTRTLKAADFDCPECGAPAGGPCLGKRQPTPIKTMHTERAEVARNSPSHTIFETASNDHSHSLTLSLVAERITGHIDPMYVSDDMLRGIEDEPRARDKYSETYAPVTETGFMVEDRFGFRLGYSPDGLVGDEGLIECKSRRQKKQVATVLEGHPPAENIAQMQTGLLVTGRKWCDYISYSGGMPMWVKRVYPDPRWFDAIINAVSAFEANAREMQRLYAEGVEGFPMTERVVEQEMIL